MTRCGTLRNIHIILCWFYRSIILVNIVFLNHWREWVTPQTVRLVGHLPLNVKDSIIMRIRTRRELVAVPCACRGAMRSHPCCPRHISTASVRQVGQRLSTPTAAFPSASFMLPIGS